MFLQCINVFLKLWINQTWLSHPRPTLWFEMSIQGGQFCFVVYKDCYEYMFCVMAGEILDWEIIKDIKSS